MATTLELGGSVPQTEQGFGPETIAARFNEIVSQLDQMPAVAPEVLADVAATSLQKNTGLSDDPKAFK